MKENTFYFSHDCDARLDEKIIQLRISHNWEGYGLYWALIEKLMGATDYVLSCDYNLLSFDLRAKEELIKAIVEDFSLFEFTDGKEGFYSQRYIIY